MYTPPPPGLESTGLYDNGNAMVPLPSGVPANGEGFISTDLGKILTNKLSSYAIGAAVNFGLQNTVIELPPPLWHGIRAAERRRPDCRLHRWPGRQEKDVLR